MSKLMTYQTLLIICLGCYCQGLWAQFSPDPYAEVYPKREFSICDIKEKGYQKVVIWYNEYSRGEKDESGMTWSNYINSYQHQKHVFPAGQLELSTYYYPDGNKIKSYQYYYIGRLISVVDELSFDSMQEESVKFSYQYAYKDTVPFEMVKIYPEDKGFRIMHDYLFDKEGRLIREKVTAHGQLKRLQTLSDEELEISNSMVLAAYQGDSKTLRFYKDQHSLFRTERTQYSEEGLLINTRIKDGEHRLIADIGYSYEGESLVKETHTSFDGTQMVSDKIIHYRYNDEGLLEQKIIEKGEQQIIFSYQYSIDY